MRGYRVLAEEAELNVRSDKRKHPPHGLFGGREGAPSWNIIRGADGRERVLPVLLTTPEPLRRGDLYHHAMAGGGGYGDPLERDPELVLWDVIEGKISIPHAAAAYGVVVRKERPPTVDVAATAARRAEMRDATPGRT